jgi:hypothetical protein
MIDASGPLSRYIRLLLEGMGTREGPRPATFLFLQQFLSAYVRRDLIFFAHRICKDDFDTCNNLQKNGIFYFSVPPMWNGIHR